MKSIDFKKWLPHIVAVAIFLLLSVIYLLPTFQGMSLKQDDIDNHKGVAKEIYDYREEFGEEPLWTNGMFGGMPATQVSVVHDSNLMNYVNDVITLWLPNPVSYLFLYILGFYILCICMSVRPWLSIVGAIMFGFSSFFFVSLAVGHNSKILAMAFMPMLVGTFVYTMRKKAIVGAVFFTLILALQLRSNHVQIVYYTFLILLGIGILEFIKYLKEKKLASFFKRTAMLVGGLLIGVACNYGVIFMTYDYLPDSQRGPSELTESCSKDKKNDEGMGLAYMTNWSYGFGESINMMIPNAKGPSSGPYILEEDMMEGDASSDELKSFVQTAYQDMGWQVSKYWGNQPGTSGPVYIGSIVFFLCFLGLFFLKDKIKWPLLLVAILALFLSWGHNFMWLTEFFYNYFPGYSKFRAVTMILVIVELTLPLIAILWVNQLLSDDDNNLLEGTTDIFNKSIETKKLFFGVSGVFVLFMLIMAIKPDVFLNFTTPRENQIFTQLSSNPNMAGQIGSIKTELIEYRTGVMKSDAWRSLGLVLAALVLLFAYFKRMVNQTILIAVLGVLVLVDLWGVSRRYLHNDEYPQRKQSLMGVQGLEHWQDKELKKFPYPVSVADMAIFNAEARNVEGIDKLLSENIEKVNNKYEGTDHLDRILKSAQLSTLSLHSNYKVLELGNPLNSARTSFFHKSVGGYSSVKMKRMQEFIDCSFEKEYNGLTKALNESFSSQNFEILSSALKKSTLLNLMNTRYVIFSLEDGGIIDPSDLGSLKSKPGVLKNPHALGNGWSVKNIVWVENADEEMTAVTQDGFDPSVTVVIDKRYKDAVGDFSPSGTAKVELTQYRPNSLTYKVNAQSEDFIVFSEVFYDKGWTAYLDGQEVPHARVNYVFRGMKIPAGEHTVEFKFDLPLYHTSATISLAASSLLLIAVGFVLYMLGKGKAIPEV